MTKEDIQRYRYGGLANALLKSEDLAGVQESLNLLAVDLGLGDEAKGFMDGAMASEQGIATAAGVYAKKRSKALEESTIKDLGEYFNDYIGYVNAENAEKLKGVLGKYSDKTLGEIKKKVDRAEYVLKGKDKYAFKPEEIEEAKSIVRDYKPLFEILGTVEQAEMDTLIPKVRKKVTKKSLEKIAKDL